MKPNKLTLYRDATCGSTLEALKCTGGTIH